MSTIQTKDWELPHPLYGGNRIGSRSGRSRSSHHLEQVVT